MKRVFTRQSNTLAILLAVSIALSASGITPVEAKTLWNPMNWFSGESQTEANNASNTSAVTDEELARQKAEEAQQAAERALEEAQRALQKAEQAKKEAEALKQKASNRKKPVVTPPEAAEQIEATHSPNTGAEAESSQPAQTEAKLQLQTVQENETVYSQQSFEEKATTENSGPKSEPWNPMSWFKRSEPAAENKAQEAPAASAEAETVKTNAVTSVNESQPDRQEESSDTSSKGSAWNPVNWFSKSSKTASNQPATESSKLEQAEPEADASVKTKAALIETEKGNIAIELYPEQAPQTVNNFVELVRSGFYNRFNMKFHRVVPGFVVQTGDPTGTGAGGSKKSIPLEAKNKLSHNTKGVVAMARGADPNSATSQFYITLTPQTTLDGKYAIFGKVISGMDVLDKIEKDDMMYGIRLVDLNTVVRDPAPDKKKFFSSLF
jgi:peptidyl-prolyl cis-trans isomerase B (cyclophilin B)